MVEPIDAITVFYSEETLAESDSRSPSAGKPKHVVAAWQEVQLPIDIRAVVPVTQEDLYLAHDQTFVQDILEGRADNGFGNRRADVVRSLPYTSGAMLCAARHALQYGIACAPVSGFHHAEYAVAKMFCTFNGLAVSAHRLLREGRVKRAMILDCDYHYGDGTENIIEHLKLTKDIDNVTFGRWFRTPSQATHYMRKLVSEIQRFSEFDLVLYQAGADTHVNDPLGGVLTTQQMRERDSLVFNAAKVSGTPLAWNLAGGYQIPINKVVALHVNTMRECVSAYTHG